MDSMPFSVLESISEAEADIEVSCEISVDSSAPSNRDSSFAAFIVGALVASGAIPYSSLVDEPSVFIMATKVVARCLRQMPEYDAHGDWVEVDL